MESLETVLERFRSIYDELGNANDAISARLAASDPGFHDREAMGNDAGHAHW